MKKRLADKNGVEKHNLVERVADDLDVQFVEVLLGDTVHKERS